MERDDETLNRAHEPTPALPDRSLQDVRISLLDRLQENLLWLFRLRWFAILGVAAVVGTCILAGLLKASAWLALPIGVLVVHNLLVAWAARNLTPTRLLAVARASMAADIATLTWIIHLAGGVENPFAAFYLFHVVIAGILLAEGEAYAFAALAAVLYAVTEGLETAGFLAHWHVGVRAHDPSGAAPWLGLEFAGACVGVAISAFATAYFITRLMRRLRESATHERELERQLLRRDRMLVMGELASGVLHEINGPLDAVQSALPSLRREPALSEGGARLLDLMEEALARIGRTSHGLLGLARRRKAEVRDVDPNAVVRDALRFVEHRLHAGHVALETDLGVDVPRIHGDPEALCEALLNLLNNALDAVPSSTGRLRVATLLRSDGPAPEVRIEVSDNGPGFPPEVASRIFSPFFTTKPDGKGSGLGLPIAQRIATDHGGTVEARSGPAGATFTLRLPVPRRNGEGR